MNECYYYLLLLLNFFSYFQHSLSYENDFSIHLPNITIQHICEHDLLFIKCLNINETIQIIRSMYGRTSQRICNNDSTFRFFDKTCANIEQSKYQTKLRCHGKSTCQLLIDNHLFTDPCGVNIQKHFEIHYRCINKEEICSKLVFNCSKSNDLKCIQKIQEDFSCQCPSTICRYVNNQIIGFIENFCPEQNLQGFHWTKTSMNKGQYLSCPSPCTGEIVRFCNSNSQWSKPNYTNCECPIEQSDQLSTHRLANSYVFQCNFWLINRILPKDNSCILSFTNWTEKTYDDDDDGSLNCLLSAFQQMTFQSCLLIKSFGIDFQNLAFEIYIPMKNESQFYLFSQIQSNQIIIDRTDIIKENFRANLPMMIIDTKISNSKNKSIILIEQENDLNSIQTANVTIIFNHQSSKFHYQCRAYHSTNFSSHVDSLNMFFACQLLCSNGSHVICQCPFFNPFMHYILYIDTSRTENDLMIDNDLNGKCLDEKKNSIDENLNKIDRYLKDISSLNFAKKLLLFIDKIIGKEDFFSNWRIIKQIEYLGFQLINITNSFISINNHIEFFIKSNQFQFENYDQSVLISIMNKENENFDFQIIFFTLSNIKIHQLINSRIVSLNLIPKNLSIDNIQITFRHLNDTNQIPTCVYLKNNKKNEVQWNTDGCQLLSTNLTHSICSYNHLSTFALIMDFQKPIMKSSENRFLPISKIGCITSIVCLLLTIIILIIMRSHVDINDDLMAVRNILHTNMLLCLIIVQILFLFGIEQTKNKFGCRIVSILIDYFLLASFSWMFVDGIELFIALKHVFKIDRIRLIAYSVYSYGFPLLFIFLSITLSAKNENGLNQYCWLSHDNAFIWGFAVPFTLLILGNLVFFIMSIYSIYKKSNPTDHINEIKFSLRNISLISILFGLTWISALFYLYNQTILFVYIFTILNSLHGLLVLIFYCLLQNHIRNLFRKFHFPKKHHISLFHCLIKTNENENHIKSLEHFSLPDNTSTSGYSSGHSSDLNNKQILCNQIIDLNPNYTNHLSHQILVHNHFDRRICLNDETPYLPSIPINLLTNRLSTFRYSLPSNEIILSHEQNQQLLQKNQIHEDDHQYYEIG